MTEQEMELSSIISNTPLLASILGNWESIAVPQAWLVAGAIAQTVWNNAFGLPPEHGIDDIDIVYFDGIDLSESAEAGHSVRLKNVFPDLPVRIDVKNQARVHTWYEDKFGYPMKPYASTVEAIGTFPTTATTIGIRPSGGALDICAPYGLSDLMAGVVRANKKQVMREIYEKKVSRWSALWPDLRIIDWEA